jgi:hypothetical protein
MICGVMICGVMLCYVMLCYVLCCYVMLRYVMLCYILLCYTVIYYMLCYVMLYIMLCYKYDVVHGYLVHAGHEEQRRVALVYNLLVLPLDEVAHLRGPGQHRGRQLSHGAGLLL